MPCSRAAVSSSADNLPMPVLRMNAPVAMRGGRCRAFTEIRMSSSVFAQSGGDSARPGKAAHKAAPCRAAKRLTAGLSHGRRGLAQRSQGGAPGDDLVQESIQRGQIVVAGPED